MSGTGRRDRDKKNGAGNFAWGKLGVQDDGSSGDSSGNSGAFKAYLEGLPAVTDNDLKNPVFYLGVMVGMYARKQNKVCGAFVSEVASECSTIAPDGTPVAGTSFDTAFRKCGGASDAFANIDKFIAQQGIGSSSSTSTPAVFIARESNNVPTRSMREGIIACGCEVMDVGVCTFEQLGSVTKSWNSKPWTTKAGFDSAIKAAAAKAEPAATKAEAVVDEPPKKSAAERYAERKAAQEELKAQKELEARMAAMDISQFTVYDDDACLGKPAPSLDSLEFVHMDPAGYKEGGVTAVVFWGKFAKGDYTTIITWSELAKKYADVQFVGVSLDAKKADAEKYVGKIGTFMATQGKNGITLAGGFPLAFDPDRKVKDAYKKLSAIMALSVGMAYLVKDGKVCWREQFTRGETPMNQFEGQLKRLLAGQDPELKNGLEPEEEEEEESDDEQGTVNVAISAAGADY